jgi:hypothetical protein
METSKELLAIEEKFWAGDAEYFRQNVDQSCLVALTTEMAGLMANADLAATVTNPDRWRNLDIELKGLVEPVDGIAILSYAASAIRESGEPYAALVSTGYVKRETGWKMMFHQHTPL